MLDWRLRGDSSAIHSVNNRHGLIFPLKDETRRISFNSRLQTSAFTKHSDTTAAALEKFIFTLKTWHKTWRVIFHFPIFFPRHLSLIPWERYHQTAVPSSPQCRNRWIYEQTTTIFCFSEICQEQLFRSDSKCAPPATHIQPIPEGIHYFIMLDHYCEYCRLSLRKHSLSITQMHTFDHVNQYPCRLCHSSVFLPL